ncbi:Bacitracin synthase [Dirofilaria immitis]
MELKEILLPLIIESRKRFGNNSLLLVLDSVKISNQLTNPKLNRKSLSGSAAGLNILELLKVSSRNNIVQGYVGEIRHWQTKSCKSLNEILISMFKIDNLDIIPSKILQDISVWKKRNDDELGKAGKFETVLCFNFIDDTEYFVSDSEILTFLDYSLQAHFGSTLQIPVEEVKQIALPVIVFRQLWIVVTESKFIKINIKLYDFDGFECGSVKRISFSSRFSESFGNFREELSKKTEYKIHEITRENLQRDDHRGNEFYSYQEIQSSTETHISDTSSSHDQAIVHVSKSVADGGNKLWIINKIRKAVEMIVEASCDDNQASFISLGFDSLKLARLELILQTELSEKFSISYGSAHQHPNINALSEYILKNSIQRSTEITDFRFLTEKLTKIVRSGIEIPLSAAQKRLIFLLQLDPERKLSFIETLKFKMENLKVRQIQKAFNRVVARHTALRAIYTITGQTILSLTEAYFSICIKSKYAFRLWKPIDLFDSSVPMRIFVIEQEDSTDRIYQEKNQWIQGKIQTMSGEVLKVKSNKSTNISNLIIIQMHHIMIDGFSIKLLTDELHVLYYEKNLLKQAKYQYGHFVLLEEQRKQNIDDRKLRKNFWQYLFLDVVLHTLPTDETKSQLGRYSGCYLQFKLDSRIHKCLQNLAVSCCVTPFSVLIANFQLLLYKRYGFKDSCIGIIVSQREIPELCTIVGCLLNVIPLINTIDPDDQIHDFIIKSCKRLNESIQKQLQFDDLIAALRLERDLPNSPLFQVLFILDDNSDVPDTEHDDMSDMKQNNEYFQNHDSNFAQYDQVWCFQRHKEGMTLKIEYNGSHFYKSTVETMVHQYFRLLYKMSQNMHICIQDIKMISSLEEFVNYQLRVENRCDFPQKCTILDFIDKQNRMNPYSNTVLQRGVAYSSTFLQRKSNQLSRFLTQSWLQFLGEHMQNDSFVVLIFDRSIYLLLIIFALWKSGIGVAPLNPEISSKQLDEILEKFICPYVIHEECKRKQHNLSNQCVFEIIPKNSYGTVQNLTSQNTKKQNTIFKHNMNEIITLISEYSDQEIRKKLIQHNLAYMTFTSGSTGTPKGICTEFYGFNNLAINYAEKLSIKSSSTIYQVVNPSFDIFFADIMESQVSGANLCLASQRIPDLEEMSEVTHAYIMPAYLSAIHSDEFMKLTNLEQINFGGDYIPHKVLQKAIQNGLRFHNQYGMTEHSIYSSCKLMKICDKISSVGKSLKNIHFSIHDNDKNLCGQRVTGICYTSGSGISRGYHDNEHLNQISFPINHDLIQLELLLNYDKRYFCSGDMAEIKNNVGELHFHGRNDFQVKIRGMQVNILTIEAILGQHHLVKECIVCLQRTETEELLIAYIISCNDFMVGEEQKQLIIKNLNEYMLVKLPVFMIPNDYVFVQEFPLSINGKIDRKLLSILSISEKLPNSRSSLKIDYIFEPREKKIMEVFTALLPGKTIQLEDSFFEVGGDSLKALIAIQNIKRETGLNLQLRDIFELTSFRAILERLKDNYSTDSHEELENSKKLKFEKFESNLLQIHSKPDKLTSDHLININNMLTEDSDEFMDKEKTVKRRMSWESEKIYSDDKQKNRFWSDLSIPISLQQERLLFLYSFGEEYRESYKLQFLIVFHDHINLKILNIALNYMMRKHRVLRTIFSQKAGKTFQELSSLSECYIEVQKNVPRYDGTESRKTSKLSDSYDIPLLTIIISNNRQLLLTLDHLIIDGRSIAILSNDLVEFYNRLISGGSVSSDVSKDCSYAEFCLKQRSQLEKFQIALKSDDSHSSTKDELQLQEECRNLKEMIRKLQNFPPLSLQGDLSNEDSDRRNNVIKFKMPVDLSAIKHFCTTERCTLFAYLLCIFSLTIQSIQANKHQQKYRFAIVSSALNRTSDTMNCVGLFVNNIIIPIDITFQSISELIRNLQQNIANVLQFQHIPFDYIIQKLNPKRSSTDTETYQISFVVQNASPIKLPKIDGVETVTEEIGAKYAKFDQAWYCTEFEDYIEILVEYRIAKYSDLKIKNTMELFTQIASQVLSNRFAKVQDILKYSKLANVEKLLSDNENQENMIEVQNTIEKNWMLEESLLDIWKEVLGSDEITIFDNFFARGGHSLLIPNICYKIEQQINYQCPPKAIFKYQTVKELAEYISNKQNSKFLTTSKQILKIHVCPLQESLLRMYYNLAEEAVASISSSATSAVNTTTTLAADFIKAYQTGFSISLKSIDLIKLRQSLNLIIMRHSSLRTTFYCQNNNFYQEIHSGTENYIIPRKITSKQASLIVPNPFHTIPILCWLDDDIKQELADDDNHCELHFKISHVICDGKSLSIIAKELYYNYFNDIHILIKNENFIQFSKRIEQRFRERNSELKSFWSQTLKDAENINLHYQKITAVASSSSNRCKSLRRNFKNLHIFIKRVAKKCCCTPFVVQLAAFSKVLSGIVIQASKVIISCPVDMRDSEAQQCVGMCINVLPVIINLKHRNFQDLIQNVAKSLADAYLNADISIEEIEKLCEKHGISNFADIMIVNNYEEYSDGCYQILNDSSEFTKCALTLFLMQHQEDIVAKIEFKQHLFYNESMHIMLNQWAKIIRRMEMLIVANDEMKYKQKQKCLYGIPFNGENYNAEKRIELNMESEDKVMSNETEECFVGRNQDGREIPQKCDYPTFSYQHLLQEGFTAHVQLATMTALIGSKESINYRTLNRLIYQTSKIIQEKVTQITGITLRADTVIPVIARNNIKTLITCLAVIMAGAAYLPVDSTSPLKRILNILKQMKTKFYITVDTVMNNNEEFQKPPYFSFQNITEINLNNIKLGDESLETPVNFRNTPNDLVYVIFTSGTTGKPKGVAIGQHGLLNMAIACTRDFWMKPGDCVYQFTNFTFDNSVLEIMMALINGSSLLIREDFFMPRKFLNEMKHARITHALLFPGLVNTFTDDEIEELRHLRYWIVGAESVSRRVLEHALKSGVNVIQNYGPTETTAYALTKRMKLLDKPNNIGRGITNAITVVRNFCGEVVPKTGVGELCIEGVGIMRGYIISSTEDAAEESYDRENESRKYDVRKNETSEIIVCHQIPVRLKFNTKDMVRLQPNNDILFLGRYDKQVKIRGYRVELGEIETVLCQYPQVKSAKVIQKLINGQKQLAAFIISSNLSNIKFHSITVRQFALEHLPYYMVPTQYHFLQQYPLTKNSKIDVVALEMLQNSENDQYFKHIEPENSIESELLGLFRKVLQDDNISMNDDFFAVGGNSFSAARLTELIEANIGHCFNINNIFHYRTVRKLSRYILDSYKEANNERIIQNFSGIHKKNFKIDKIPLSFQQQQFRFLNETKQRRYYELIFVQNFDALLSLRHLKLAFLRLILRQSSFRTIFPEKNYDMYQEILSGTEAYFYSNNLHNNYFPIQLDFYDDDRIAEKIKILQNERINFKHEPPVLCAVEAINNTSYTIILRMNHIISDAWSTNLLENDLRDLYQEILKTEQFSSNSKLPLTYAEYSIDQFEKKRFLEKLAAKYADKIVKWIINDENYNKISDNWERIDQINQFRWISQNLDSEIFNEANQYTKSTDFRNYSEIKFTFEVGEIEKICGYFEITPFVAFLSAFVSSLHELSGTNQLIINVPVANRSLRTDRIIGNFLNYLLISSTHITSKKTNSIIDNAINTISRNTIDSPINSVKIDISNQQTEGRFSLAINADIMKNYLNNINTTVNEVRQFEQVPFIELLKLIRTKLKKLKSLDIEILDRLHKTIFFNFRYGLEENHESTLGKGKTQEPTDCIHEIEVEIDRIKSYYSCKIRMKNHRNSRKHILALCQWMIFSLKQMSINPKMQEVSNDEIKLKESKHEATMKDSLFFTNSVGENEIELELRRIWSECLKKKRIRDDDDFFLEGGTSLLTLKLRGLIESELKIHIEIDEIFKYSTFTKLSNLLQKRFVNKGFLPDERIEFLNLRSEKNNDLILQSDKKKFGKRDTAEETENLEISENRSTIRLFHQREPNINITENVVIVFFHALVGGVTWTYASLIRQLIRKLKGLFTIIGVEHPDSFSRRCSRDPKFYHSIESLCFQYVRDLDDHLRKVKIRIFIGASFGAILAYQCALQLQQQGIHINDIISIDGTSQWCRNISSTELSSYEEHCQQINKIVKYRTDDIKIDSEILEAMIENSWELLKMMCIYIPSRKLRSPSRLHVTLLKSSFQKTLADNDDYGWMNLCSRTIINIPFSHDTMLDDCNIDTIVDIIIQTIEKVKRQ